MAIRQTLKIFAPKGRKRREIPTPPKLTPPKNTNSREQNKIELPKTTNEKGQGQKIVKIRQIIQQIIQNLLRRKKKLEEYDQQKFTLECGKLLTQPQSIGWTNPQRFTLQHITMAYQQSNKEFPQIFKSGKERVFKRHNKTDSSSLIIYPHEKAGVICYKTKEGKTMVVKVVEINLRNIIKDRIEISKKDVDSIINAIFQALNTWASYRSWKKKNK
ncbi:MAG: hypothetical protein QXZ13_01175 [Candidatus Diapherotrites archaeon]